MKWNILVGSLVLGFGLCTQSFGLDLLDRMLGTNYNGCWTKRPVVTHRVRIQDPAAAVILDAMCNACPARQSAGGHRCWTCSVAATSAKSAATGNCCEGIRLVALKIRVAVAKIRRADAKSRLVVATQVARSRAAPRSAAALRC